MNFSKESLPEIASSPEQTLAGSLGQIFYNSFRPAGYGM